MNKTKIIASLAIIFLAGSAMAQNGQASATEPTQQTNTDTQATTLQAVLVNTDPIPLQTNEDADVTFKITNSGTAAADGVTAEIIDSYPFSLKPDRQRTYDLGRIVQREEYQISTDIKVAEDASDGSHDLPIRVSNGEFSRILRIPIEVQSDDIDLNLANLRTTPDELRPDTEDNKLTISVVNNGDKQSENTVLDLNFPAYLEERSSFSTRQSLGNLQPGQTKQAEFFFDTSEDAPSGEFQLNSTLEYTSEDSTAEVEKDQSFNVFMAGKPQYEIINTSSDLKVGDTGEVRVTLRNTGNEESTSTRVRILDSSDLPFSYRSSSQFVGTLDPNEVGTAVFEVTVESDAVEKDYLLDFEARGVKDTEVFTDTETLRLPVENTNQESGSGLPVPLPVLLGIGLLVIGGYYFRDKFSSSNEDN